MKNLESLLLSPEPVSEIVIGNTAVVRAFVETGTHVVTAYPGSPTPEIASAIGAIPAEKRPFYFEFSINEKVATEVAFGAALNGHLSCVFFKSVGLNVAADTFVQLGHMEIAGGLVVVLGDDPGAHSSQNEQDNRHLARLAYIPVLEPATAEESYTFYREAARLARSRRMPVILRLTTHTCHQKERVQFGAWDQAPPDDTPRFDPAAGPFIPITTEVFPLKRRALRKLADVEEWAATAAVNRIEPGDCRRGVITAGVPYLSLQEALIGAGEKPGVLKLGTVYPLPRRLVSEFLRAHDEVKVLEELDDVIETDVKALAYEEGLRTRVIGKADAEERMGEHTPERVLDILARTWPGSVRPAAARPAVAPPVPGRPAQMCPGCGHRSAFHAVRKALQQGDITVADIGCHSLGFLPPYRMGEVLMCMGASTGIASGLALFNTSRPVVAFLGDSTFFHAGLPGIVNALFNRHNVTLILMENGTTAMTGHQDHPAAGRNFNGATEAIPVRQVLEGLGVRRIYEADTYQQSRLTGLVREAMEDGEFSVVIARHPCMLKLVREQRRKGSPKARPVKVDDAACTRAHDCVAEFACPSFQRDAEGSVTVHPELCIGDGSCLQTCPSAAIKREK